jgi:TonB family protein
MLAATAVMAQEQSDASVAQTTQAELSAWKTYTVKDEDVSVSFPTHPAVTTARRFQEGTRQILKDRIVGAYADGVVYGVYVYENPKPRVSFEAFVAAQQQDGADLAKAQTVKLGRFTGKQYSSQNKDLPSTVQFFAVEDRLYKFIATGASAEDDRVKQFFSSIVFDRTKSGIEVSDGPGLPFAEPRCAELFVGRQVDRKARLVIRPEPPYTESARQNEVAGTVILKVVFACNGRVNNIVTAQALPYGLTEQAIAAAKKIKFIPAVKEGKYASMWMQLEYNFNLY